MNFFEEYHKINNLINAGNSETARNELIKLLDIFKKNNIKYDEVTNSLIRQVGLFPYMQPDTARWQDRFVFESFKADIGEQKKIILHREQSLLLKKLLNGENIAVSAPTSFGKSFVIDSFISIKKPNNIVIIVPTIALTDETRRRLQKKFAPEYRLITTSDAALSEKNIFIFPQERALSYLTRIKTIDILIVDEFYKASFNFDKERSPSLLRAILKLKKISKQRYFLAPNIAELKGNIFTEGMDFFEFKFNTVFLEKHELFEEINGDETIKSKFLLDILKETKGKTLIYAGTYPNISNVATLLISTHQESKRELLIQFKKWLEINYSPNWQLTKLVSKGTGIHNGQLHRSLSQIQIKLFEERDGLKNIVSTSSIIEGVNTCAENVVLWSNLSGAGRAKINDFTYKNIIGRSGRMFKHFIGKVFILEMPPAEKATNLELPIPDNLLGSIDDDDIRNELTKDQVAKIIAYKEEMETLIGEDNFKTIQNDNALQSCNSTLILGIARDIHENSKSWNGIGYLNSENPEDWDRFLYKAINFQTTGWGAEYRKLVTFVKTLSLNWKLSIPQMLQTLSQVDITIDDFFKLERTVTFKLSAILTDMNTIQKKMLGQDAVDISPFISKLSHAFLPTKVYQLEEYGLPRMISKKIHNAHILDITNEEISLHLLLDQLREIGHEKMCQSVNNLNEFDKYILKYFYDGISSFS
jgi:hypothetical protein